MSRARDEYEMADEGHLSAHALALVLQSCKAAFAELGVVLGRPLKALGCGYWGCTYPIRRGAFKGKVLKITTDRDEAYMAEYLRAHRATIPSMLPQIDVARRLRCGSAHRFGVQVYMIIREDLADLPADDYKTTTLDTFEEPQNTVRSGLRGGRTDMRVAALRLATLAQGLDAGPRRTAIVEAVKLLRWAASKGARFSDLGSRNWGVRADGLPVIRDIGVSHSPKRRLPDPLGGLRFGA